MKTTLKTRQDLIDYISAHAGEDGKVYYNGVTVWLDDDQDPRIERGKVSAWLPYTDDFGDISFLSLNQAHLSNAEGIVSDIRAIVKAFSVNTQAELPTPFGTTPAPVQTTDVFEAEMKSRAVDYERKIAELNGQIAVYKSLMPSTTRVTYEEDA